ncbi:MAG: LacI family transcriptional regulator [Firmicutes bacterium]|nr:LacI family transcriptional regulator [Bacillota bacterium]
MPTIYDVGRLAGVSRSTVSRVLNGKNEVDPKTAELVWDAVRKLNYHPNVSARALVRQKTDMIGVILAHVSDPYYEYIIKGVEAVVSERRMGVSFYNSYDHLETHRMIVFSVLAGNRVDGLIVVGSNLNDRETLQELIGRDLPLAFIERNLTGPGITSITSNNVDGATQAVEYLLKLGHRRIGCLTGNLAYQTAIERLEGYRATLQKYGLPVDEELIMVSNYQYSGGYEKMKQLLALPDRPTALFACNDMMAFGAISAIKEAGLSVPEDISVVGYDDITFTSMVYPPLTTVRQPLFEMGALAAQGLIERINQGDKYEGINKVLPVKLVIRKSCQEPQP